MSFRVFLWDFLLVLILSSCSHSVRLDSVKTFSRNERLIGKCWHICDSLYRSGIMRMAGDYIVIADENGSTIFSLIDRKHHSKLHRFGVMGQGPKEILSKQPFTGSDDKICLFDFRKKKLVSFDIDSISDGEKGISDIVIETEVDNVNGYAYFPEGDMFVTSGFYDHGRFCILDSKGKIVSYVGKYPIEDGNKEDYPSWIWIAAYQGELLRQPGGNKFVAMTNTAEILQIFECDYSDKSVKIVSEIINSYPKFSVSEEDGIYSFHNLDETIHGYKSAYTTPKYIYALFSGKKFMDRNGNYVRGTGNHIHVFNWNGDPIACFELDQDAWTITGTDDTLYALVTTDDGEYDIKEFNIDMNQND